MKNNKIEMREAFERDVRDVKKAIRELNLPNCCEIEEMELLKNEDGDSYRDPVTAQFYQIWLMGSAYSTHIFTLEEG